MFTKRRRAEAGGLGAGGFVRRIALLALFFLGGAAFAGAAPENGPQAEFNVGAPRPPKESVIQVIFGMPLPMPTERGTLVIDAFNDLNDDGVRNGEEDDLRGELVCSVDGVDYTLPAYIPGLRRNGNYAIRCRGERYVPSGSGQDVFIERRGQIVRIDLPCRPAGAVPLPGAERP